jgi:hypothetical protein
LDHHHIIGAADEDDDVKEDAAPWFKLCFAGRFLIGIVIAQALRSWQTLGRIFSGKVILASCILEARGWSVQARDQHHPHYYHYHERVEGVFQKRTDNEEPIGDWCPIFDLAFDRSRDSNSTVSHGESWAPAPAANVYRLPLAMSRPALDNVIADATRASRTSLHISTCFPPASPLDPKDRPELLLGLGQAFTYAMAL